MVPGFGETVQHVRFAGQKRNAHGQVIETFHDPVGIDRVGVDIPRVDEPHNGLAQRVVVDLVIFLPPGLEVGSRDKFVIRGDTYEVIGGAPQLNNFFTGTPFMTEVKLRRVTG